MLRIGILGAWRGGTLYDLAEQSGEATVVICCDRRDFVLELVRGKAEKYGTSPVLTKDEEEFLSFPMDAAILAGDAHDHARQAIRLLERGVAVLSEVLPAKTLKEGVELVETVEKTGGVYRYAENYCYLAQVLEMRRLVKAGYLGAVEYLETEYLHNCEDAWYFYTQGEENHWRNRKDAFYYCTHSVGRALYITDERPLFVTGFEPPYNDKMRRMGAKSAPFGLEIIRLTGGAIVKSLHGETQKDSTRQVIYGSRGRAESFRLPVGKQDEIFVSTDEDPAHTSYEEDRYIPEEPERFASSAFLQEIKSKENPHPNEAADVRMLLDFFRAVRGEEEEGIDVYRAMDMWLCGMFAFRSALSGENAQRVPDFRKKEERDQYRFDEKSPFSDGENRLPSLAGDPGKLPEKGVYVRQKSAYRKDEKEYMRSAKAERRKKD